MNRIMSDVWGRVPRRKKPRRLSVARWYHVVLGSLGEDGCFRLSRLLLIAVLGRRCRGGLVGLIGGRCARILLVWGQRAYRQLGL